MRFNVVYFTTDELVAALESAHPEVDFYIEEYPAIAGGCSYFIPTATRKSDGVFLSLRGADKMQLKVSGMEPLEQSMAKVMDAVIGAKTVNLSGGNPRPIKANR